MSKPARRLMSPDLLNDLTRHKVSELTRGRRELFDEAASGGVVLDASGGRPDLVMAPKSEWSRLHNLVAAGRGLADLLSDLATIVADKPLIEPRVSWISALDPEDIPKFAAEVAQGFRLSLETNNPEPLRRSLFAWKSTAEYALSGPHRELEKPDWDAVIRLMRPSDEDDGKAPHKSART
jgi:hypothetical protein